MLTGFYHYLSFICSQIIDNKEELKTKLKEILREKSDAFNSEQPEEDKVIFLF